MLKTIAIIVGLAIVAVLVIAALRPNSFRIERRITIKAPPEVIFEHINDFHKWRAWSPWENLDTDLERTYMGSPSGLGAVYVWEGKKAGAGRMEIIEHTPPSKLVIKLDFVKPMTTTNTTEITLTPQGDETVVSWAMYGPSPYMSKLFGLIFNMDKMVGKDFEKGLQSLKTVSEQ
ncbi:MAG: polyketide cyclase [Asticcacaulis sp. 32-58-5]|nr:MAG: polyketide cyclase [Asticcacaulis sp. 32-58-5]